MDNVRDALMRMVKAYNNGKKMLEAYCAVGLNDNLIHEICIDIADGIYQLIGEHTEEWKDSVTSAVLTAPYLDDERRVGMLMAEYAKNFPVQPKPVFYTREQMKEDVKKTGGYLYETPEGDWAYDDQ